MTTKVNIYKNLEHIKDCEKPEPYKLTIKIFKENAVEPSAYEMFFLTDENIKELVGALKNLGLY